MCFKLIKLDYIACVCRRLKVQLARHVDVTSSSDKDLLKRRLDRLLWLPAKQVESKVHVCSVVYQSPR